MFEWVLNTPLCGNFLRKVTCGFSKKMCISGTNRTAHARYYRAKVQIKDYNVSIHN